MVTQRDFSGLPEGIGAVIHWLEDRGGRAGIPSLIARHGGRIRSIVSISRGGGRGCGRATTPTGRGGEG